MTRTTRLPAGCPLLSGPVTVGARQAPSRAVFGPHETNLGRGRQYSERHVAYYARRARGGAGIVVTETASVDASDWPYERAPLAPAAAGWRSIADACQPYGALVLAGLGHAGGQGSSAFSQEVLWAPSRVADVVSREPPAPLEPDQIAALVQAFSAATRAALDAGLDGVEIDAGPWSLLRQFLSGLTNQRSDEFGQDRLLVLRRVVASVRLAAGSDGIVALRLSCDELAPWAGVTPDQALTAVDGLAPELDLLTVVRGGPYSTSAYRPDAHTPPNFNRDLCQQMRDAAAGRVAISLQGSVVDPHEAETSLADGLCDLVEMTRAQIAEPRLIALLRGSRAGEARPCLLCNQACQVRDNRNPIVSCVVNPSAGHETSVNQPTRTEPTGQQPGRPVLVVGAGPAGLACARVLASADRRVRVWERLGQPGGVPIRAAFGPGRQRVRAASDWLVRECDRLGVDVVVDKEATAADLAAAQAEGWAVVLATGGRPLTDRYPRDGSPVVVDALQLLSSGWASLPNGPVVVDDPVGDWVGVGVAEWLASATDRSVTIVSPDPVVGTLLSRTGDLAPANVRLQQAGVARQLRSLIGHVGGGYVDIEDTWTAAPTRLPAAVLVDCGHRVPDDRLYLEVGDAGMFRAGDCVAPRTILEAVLEGERVAARLLDPATVGAGG